MHIPKVAWIFLCICLLCLAACKQPEQPWLGKPAPDERIRLGIRNPDAHYLRSEIWETEDSAFEEKRTGPSQSTEYELDADGHILHLKKWLWGALHETTQYTYNDHGQLISSEVHGPRGEFRSCIVTTYCADGQLAEIQSFNEDKRLRRRTRYTYDDMHRLLRVEEFSYSRDAEGTQNRLVETKDYVYGYDGAQSEIRTTQDGAWKSTEYYLNGVLEKTIFREHSDRQYFYDSKGLLVAMVMRDSTGETLEKSEYNYDGDGRKVLENYFLGKNELVTSVRSTYDVHGNLIQAEEKIRRNGQPEIEVNIYKFTYDGWNTSGDWTTATSSKNDRVTRRELRFFDPATTGVDSTE